MQHLVSKSREEDVADEEVSTEDSLHRSRQEHDVGPLMAVRPDAANGSRLIPHRLERRIYLSTIKMVL